MLTTPQTAATPSTSARGAGLSPAGAQTAAHANTTQKKGAPRGTWFPPCSKDDANDAPPRAAGRRPPRRRPPPRAEPGSARRERRPPPMATQRRRRGHTGETWFPPCLNGGRSGHSPPRWRTTGAAGPGRWVNYCVDPMRAEPLLPPPARSKPGGENSFLGLAQEARNVEDVVRDLERLLAPARLGLVARERRHVGRAAPTAAVAA